MQRPITRNLQFHAHILCYQSHRPTKNSLIGFSQLFAYEKCLSLLLHVITFIHMKFLIQLMVKSIVKAQHQITFIEFHVAFSLASLFIYFVDMLFLPFFFLHDNLSLGPLSLFISSRLQHILF